MKPIRSFVSIDLSPEAQAALTKLQNELKRQGPPHSIRWTAPKNIHLTLHFLGDIAPDKVDRAAEALRASVSTQPVFSLELGRLGCFPNIRRPRIIWVGVGGDTTSLATLHGRLGRKLSQSIDFSPETRPYAPHLTIGRVKKGIPSRRLNQLGQILEREQSKVGLLAPLPVTEISLIQSDLTPTGPIYTQLAQSNLQEKR